MIRSFSTLVAGVFFLAAGSVLAAGSANLDTAGTNVFDKASLQRGATLFVNYCMGCHSMQYQRYQRVAEDLDLSEELVEEFLVKGNKELTDYMKSSMPYEESADWFGKAPPDLSLTARSRGPDWIYTFLRSYYLTDTGWNNTVLQNPAMPHVLWDLQGVQRALTETTTDAEGIEHTKITGLELETSGRLSPEAYDDVVRDITAFMEYVGEPAVLKRERIGVWVLLFLAVFTFLAYLLYVDYWKDVKK